MSTCNYFYLNDFAIKPLRERLEFLSSGGFLGDPLFNQMLYYLDTISATVEFYSDAVKKGLGEK